MTHAEGINKMGGVICPNCRTIVMPPQGDLLYKIETLEKELEVYKIAFNEAECMGIAKCLEKISQCNHIHDYEPNTTMDEMRCERCGIEAPRRVSADKRKDE